MHYWRNHLLDVHADDWRKNCARPSCMPIPSAWRAARPRPNCHRQKGARKKKNKLKHWKWRCMNCRHVGRPRNDVVSVVAFEGQNVAGCCYIFLVLVIDNTSVVFFSGTTGTMRGQTVDKQCIRVLQISHTMHHDGLSCLHLNRIHTSLRSLWKVIFYLPSFLTLQRSSVANRFLSIKQLNVKPFLNYFFVAKEISEHFSFQDTTHATNVELTHVKNNKAINDICSYNKNLITPSRSQRINISNLTPSSVYVPVELRCWDMHVQCENSIRSKSPYIHLKKNGQTAHAIFSLQS